MSPLERAARQAKWAVAGTGVAAVLAAVRYLTLLSESGDADITGRASLAGGLASLALLVSGILWVTWFRVLFEPLEQGGRTRFVGWRFWGWVIPGVDLVIPKMMVNDVWADASGSRAPAPWEVQVWWVLWAGSRVVAYRLFGDPARPEDTSDLAIGVVYFALLALAAPFAVMAITRLTRRAVSRGEL